VTQNHEAMTLFFIGLEKSYIKMRTTTTCPKPLPSHFGNKILTMKTNLIS
jgi:hypothetical protein